MVPARKAMRDPEFNDQASEQLSRTPKQIFIHVGVSVFIALRFWYNLLRRGVTVSKRSRRTVTTPWPCHGRAAISPPPHRRSAILRFISRRSSGAPCNNHSLPANAPAESAQLVRRVVTTARRQQVRGWRARPSHADPAGRVTRILARLGAEPCPKRSESDVEWLKGVINANLLNADRYLERGRAAVHSNAVTGS